MNGRIDQALHEKLCAHVLGELAGEERAELERELERSAELRAERARVEETIGLVRTSLAGETLSSAARDALQGSIGRGSFGSAARKPWLARVPALRLAAGIGAVGLGWWMLSGRPSMRSDFEVACDTPGAPKEAAGKRGMSLEGDGGLGENARDRSARPNDSSIEMVDALGIGDAADARGLDDAKRSKLDAEAQLRAEFAMTQPAAGAEIVNQSGEQPAALHGRGQTYAGGGDTVPPGGSGGIGAGSGKPTMPGLASASTESVGAYVEKLGKDEGKQVGPTGPSTGGAPGSKDGENLLGWNSNPNSNPAPSAMRGAAPATKAKGSEGGANVPPPSSPGPATTSSTSYLGRAAGRRVDASGEAPAADPSTAPSGGVVLLAEERDAFERLSGLGYAGDDGDNESKKRQEERRVAWMHMTIAEREQYLNETCRRIVSRCTRMPNERPRDMFFRFWGDNPFEVAALDSLSTFSVDVDTASYALARRYLDEGHVPEKAQVRTEEFVNYFGADVPAPRTGTFSVHSDLTPSRFSADSARQMLRVVVRAKDVEKLERQSLRLTFVVDVSGSMRQQDRLETVKHALRMLIAQLESRDSIAIVKFSTDASLVLPMTPVIDRAGIEAAVTALTPDGSTNWNAGLQLGYAQALGAIDGSAVNRVVLLSDGVANVGETDPQKILDGVAAVRAKGVYLNTVGVGMGNVNDTLLEQLANKGDGMCNYVDSPKEIQRALVERFTGAFQPVAKDVKIQVEFDPAQVVRYRLLGYENRAIADADFRNDKVDAGEVGAGHQVTALYEIEPTGVKSEKPLATVRLRWKPMLAGGAASEEAVEAAFPVQGSTYQAYESAPPGYRRAVIAAQFAEILRRSVHARGETLDDLAREAELLRTQIPNDKDFAELCGLILRSKTLILTNVPGCDELCQAIDFLQQNRYLLATAEEARGDEKLLAEIATTTKKLEDSVRELLRRQLEEENR